MPFALIGFVLGWMALRQQGTAVIHDINNGELPPKLLLVVMCMVLARNAAMAFNRYLDRHFDALNPRTAIREIPSGVIKAERALLFVIVNGLFFIMCTYFINPLCFYLSPVALGVVLGYSYTKRFTAWCHIILGIGLALAPIGAYLAVTGRFDWLPLFFSFAVVTWVSGFDIIYSLQDEEFDREHQLHSIPVRWGKATALNISTLLHVVTACCLALAGLWGTFSWLYLVGWVLFTALLVYQHSIVSPNDLRRVNLAFMTANGMASVVFSVITITDLVRNGFN